MTHSTDKSSDLRPHFPGIERLVLPEHPLGVLAASGDEVIGMDLFDCPRTLKKLWGRLCEACFLEAARAHRPRKVASVQVAEDFLT